MVVIEPVPGKSEETNRDSVEPKPSTTDTAPERVKEAESSEEEEYKGGTIRVSGYASDGFETASETEVNDDDAGDEHDQEQRHVEQSLPPIDHSSQNSINDVELQQKAIAQANDAKLEGNKLFGDGQYDKALSQYELALQLAADTPSSAEVRSICHSNSATCLFKLGKYEDSIKECTKALELNPTYVKALLRRGEAHEKLEHYEEAVADMTKILEVDPSHYQARRAIVRLEPLAREKREKMKEEMIGKLKDMGNSILGRFGMSVDNFKSVKDPNTGSYSISFQR